MRLSYLRVVMMWSEMKTVEYLSEESNRIKEKPNMAVFQRKSSEKNTMKQPHIMVGLC